MDTSYNIGNEMDQFNQYMYKVKTSLNLLKSTRTCRNIERLSGGFKGVAASQNNETTADEEEGGRSIIFQDLLFVRLCD